MKIPCCPAGTSATSRHNEVFGEGAYFPMEVVTHSIHEYELVNLFSIPQNDFYQR